MSQASRQVTSTQQTSSFSTGDFIALIAAIVLFVAFWLLPWFEAAGASMSGSGLMSGFWASSPVANPAGLLLLPIGALVGVVAGVLGLLRPDARPVTRYMAVIGGLVALLYYVSDVIALQAGIDIEGALGIGFWVGLAVALGLVAQAFVPRYGQPPLSSTERIRTIQLLLVVGGLVVTGYMSYNKLAGLPLTCSETGLINCSVVENSAWARVAGIPTAVLGFMAHVMIGAVLLLETRVSLFRSYGVLMAFGLAVFGVMYHAYLTYVSFTILRAVCPYCLTAATIMVFQLVATSIRLKRYLAAP